MDKVLRGRWRNTPSHLSLMSAGDFWGHTLKLNISHASVVFGREVFGKVIRNIVSSLLPVEADLKKNTTLYPVEAHVKGFGAFLAHVAGGDAVGG